MYLSRSRQPRRHAAPPLNHPGPRAGPGHAPTRGRRLPTHARPCAATPRRAARPLRPTCPERVPVLRQYQLHVAAAVHNHLAHRVLIPAGAERARVVCSCVVVFVWLCSVVCVARARICGRACLRGRPKMCVPVRAPCATASSQAPSRSTPFPSPTPHLCQVTSDGSWGSNRSSSTRVGQSAVASIASTEITWGPQGCRAVVLGVLGGRGVRRVRRAPGFPQGSCGVCLAEGLALASYCRRRRPPRASPFSACCCRPGSRGCRGSWPTW